MWSGGGWWGSCYNRVYSCRETPDVCALFFLITPYVFSCFLITPYPYVCITSYFPIVCPECNYCTVLLYCTVLITPYLLRLITPYFRDFPATMFWLAWLELGGLYHLLAIPGGPASLTSVISVFLSPIVSILSIPSLPLQPSLDLFNAVGERRRESRWRSQVLSFSRHSCCLTSSVLKIIRFTPTTE